MSHILGSSESPLLFYSCLTFCYSAVRTGGLVKPVCQGYYWFEQMAGHSSKNQGSNLGEEGTGREASRDQRSFYVLIL